MSSESRVDRPGHASVTFAIPFLPLVEVLGFTALPGTVFMTLIGITVLYIGATELARTWFYRGHA